MPDLGFTHIALEVSNIDNSIAFYQKYAGMQVVHRRTDSVNNVDVVWISDLTRPFVIVLIQTAKVSSSLCPNSHLGVACESREEIDRLCRQASSEGILIDGPSDRGAPVGYWAYIRDPDGHTLEISYGQEVRLAIESH
ncbi:MAG: VOC family protein [Leptolyngbyaceae cyanobacterium MO_188.B28]|nr:VOC family protein [Leptolyngbyaceae cyanobacterium MO_188.B28]